MSSRKQNSTAKLPQSLLDEINGSSAGNDRMRADHGKGKQRISRKDARKQQRTDSKKRKAEHFSNVNPNKKRSTEGEHVESPQRKRRKFSDPKQTSYIVSNSSNISVTAPKMATVSQETLTKKSDKPKTESKQKTSSLEKLVAKSERPSKSIPRSQQEKDEEEYIAYLEAKLGYDKREKRQKKDDELDGLDDLLDFTSTLLPSYTPGPSKARSDYSDEDEVEITNADGMSSAEGLSASDGSEDEYDEGEEEWNGFGESSAKPADDTSTTQEDLAPPIANIQPSETRYVPPHLRKQMQNSELDSEEQVKLIRQVKGLMNRMSEQNMSTILDGIEELYRKHRRHDVTSTITTLLIEGISSHSMLLDSYVVLHAAFISCLHKLIGIEFAAYFVQNVVNSYEQQYEQVDTQILDTAAEPQDDRGKECSNLIVLLSELYNFQVISCILVYDAIRQLLGENLSEFNVELLLKILRNSGQQLRMDDPSALKDIITIVQNKVTGGSDTLSSRSRFMVETLNNLKNNKVKKSAAQHQGGDVMERMKKFISGLSKKRHVLAHEPLRVSLSDLHSAESKGKWWLVGAAWGGDPLVDRQGAGTKQADEDGAEDLGNSALLRLAKKQGMNTDIRRSIFVVLMSSDDYVDACERLSQLNLTEVQQREIIRVTLHCCGNEKAYNPYYTLVCQHLCRTSHSYKVTLQYCLWDLLRDLGETNVGGAEVIKNLNEDSGGFDVKNISSTRISNVAKAYAWWITRDCCSLIILKPVDFTILKQQTRKFLKELLVDIFIASQMSSPMFKTDLKNLPTTRNRGALEEVFIKASRLENLGLGLMYFMSENFRTEDGVLKWASGVARETLQAGMGIVPSL